MNCSLCDTVNDDSANFCSQCGMSLSMRECAACGAVFDKSASQCPKCGEPVPVAVHSAQPAMHPPVAAEVPATAAPLALALPGEADLTVRLVKLLEQIEGELAARRVAAASFEEVPALLSSASPARVDRTAERIKPKRTTWFVVGALVIAASGALLYRFHDQLLDRFHRMAQTLPTSLQSSSGPAVAADPVAVSPAPTPASPAVAAQSGPASAPAAQVELSRDAKGAEPADAALSTNDSRPPASEAAAQAPASNAELPSAAAAPEAVKPAQSAPSMRAPPEPELSREETTDAQPAGTHEEAVVAPTPDPKPADDYHCRDGAVSAMGLCGATSQGAR